MKEEKKTEYQTFLDKVKKFELRPGSVKPVHIFRELHAILEGSEIRLIPKSSSSGPEGTIFYNSYDNHVWVGTE